MTLTVLFCADPVNPRHTDGHFARESAAVRDVGGVTALIDHDALRFGDAAKAVRHVPPGLGPAWYRGRMVTGEQYSGLAKALKERGARLVTTPGDYVRAHELPGWHDTFAGLTPASVWLPLSAGEVPDPDELADLVRELPDGPAIVRDYVTSHQWDEAYVVPDLRDTGALHRAVARMVGLQGDQLAGGLVVRAHEPYHDGGARIWWVDGEPVLMSSGPGSPHLALDADAEIVRPVVRTLGCRFITTDLARCGDGEWRVAEVGDGQVSDLPSTVDPVELYEQLPGGFLS